MAANHHRTPPPDTTIDFISAGKYKPAHSIIKIKGTSAATRAGIRANGEGNGDQASACIQATPAAITIAGHTIGGCNAAAWKISATARSHTNPKTALPNRIGQPTSQRVATGRTNM